MSRMPNKRAAEVLGRMLQNGVGGNYPWLAVVESEAIRTALAALAAREYEAMGLAMAAQEASEQKEVPWLKRCKCGGVLHQRRYITETTDQLMYCVNCTRCQARGESEISYLDAQVQQNWIIAALEAKV